MFLKCIDPYQAQIHIFVKVYRPASDLLIQQIMCPVYKQVKILVEQILS